MAVLERKSAPKKIDVDRRVIGVGEVLEKAGSLGIGGFPLDVERLANAFSLRVLYEPLSTEVSGKIQRTGTGYVITVNALHHPNRQRFTLAHEIAHFCLHRSLQDEFIDEVFFRNDTTSRLEMEANRFAADLLMPERYFREFIATKSTTVEDIAEYFKVSAMAVRYRAKQLGYRGHGLS